jgi:hypothetical protein
MSSHLLPKNLKIKIYKTMISSAVLCGCETWSVTLREEHRLRVFENRVLRRILFRPLREEAAGDWRRLHNEELHNLYASPHIIMMIKSRRVGWAGDVALMGEMRNAYKILVGKLEGKRPLEKPRRRWENDIRMDLTEIGWEGVDWIHVAENRDQRRAVVDTVMNLRAPRNV